MNAQIMVMLKLLIVINIMLLVGSCKNQELPNPCENKETKLEQKWEVLYYGNSTWVIEYKTDSTFYVTESNDTINKGTWKILDGVIYVYSSLEIPDRDGNRYGESRILKLKCDTLRTVQIYPPSLDTAFILTFIVKK